MLRSVTRLALVEEQGTLATQAPSATPAVVVVDDDRRCVEANPYACELLGRRRAQVVGKVFDSLFASDMRERFDHFWKAFAEEGGHAGPFEAGDGLEVELAVTRNVVAGRHLLMISRAGHQPRPRRFAPATEGATQPEAPARPSSPRGVRVAGGRTPSARECEILRLLATGATDPQIAAMLGLSPATVQTHVRNAKAKLGARTRAQAVAMAIGQELISPPPSA